MKTFSLTLLIGLTAPCLKAQVPEEGKANQQEALSYEASYVGDVCANIRGGIRTGCTYIGLANFRLGYDPELAGIWKGGYFFINGAAAHGESPSETLSGDFQVASNIDAGDHIYLHELWFRQKFGRTDIIAGLQDLNTLFLVSEKAGYYLNSSFGVPSVISDNAPVPIYPLTALGITTFTAFTNEWSLGLAVFDGCPTHFEANPYNTDWKLKKDDGTLWIGELQYSYVLNGLPGKMKAGYYYHSRLVDHDEETGQKEEVFDYNHGSYLIAEQEIWKSATNGSSLGIFTQVAVSPKNKNTHHFYGGAGINYYGIFDASRSDALGMAVAHARFNQSSHRTETVLELFYKSNLTGTISIQPDFQYIINPAGTTEQLQDAVLTTLRIGIHF